MGIKNTHLINDKHANDKATKSPNDALNDLIANLSNGTDKSHIDNNTSIPSSAWQVLTKYFFF